MPKARGAASPSKPGSRVGVPNMETANRAPEEPVIVSKSRFGAIMTPAAGTQVVRPPSRAVIQNALLAEAPRIAARVEPRDYFLGFPNLLLNSRLRRLEFVGFLCGKLLKAFCDR